MNRCFVEPQFWWENEIELSADESHHLLDVLRARPGETIEIFDGQGRTANAELMQKRKPRACPPARDDSGRPGSSAREALAKPTAWRGKQIARIKILPATTRITEPYCPAFILLQAVPKHSSMELIVQKATELGVKTIVPLITERTVVKKVGPHSLVRPRISAGQGCPALPTDKHTDRWQKVALAAVKQCRSAWLPEILPIVPLAEAVAGLQADLKIFGALDPRALHFKETLAQVPRAAIKSIALLIGPEGDFTGEETNLLLKAGFTPVSFGSEVLRVETAAIFGLSALKYEFHQEKQKAEGKIFLGSRLYPPL